MELKSKYIREQERYTQNDICSIFECSDDRIVPMIRKLKEYGILKAVKATDSQKEMSDLIDEDVVVADVETGENEFYYVFTFVGIIVVFGFVLMIYPKYLVKNKEPKDELKKVLKVLEKFNSKEQIVRMFNDSSESSSFNLLAVLLYLIHDYYENGVYTNTEQIIESNGTGDILWDKTINETFALISNNRPYYIDLQTKKRVNNDYDYFKRLHECILTRASRELKDAGLLDLFEITEVDLSDEDLTDFGEEEYILYKIEKELNVQFNTRKQLVLKTVYAYIDQSGSLYDVDCISLFGTNKFNIVWEKVCAEIMDNLLEKELDTIPLPTPLKPGYNRDAKLKELKKKPLWTITGERADDTLIPDIITILDKGFYIFDAKYYNARLEPNLKPKRQPGIESVTKQYLYQLAYQKFITDHGFDSVRNCFILPTESSEEEDKEDVKMDMLNNLKLQSIKVRLLPADRVYDHYLEGSKYDIGRLNL